MFHHLAQLLSQFCQFPISPGRTRQRVEQPKSKSTQPRFARRRVTLYKVLPAGSKNPPKINHKNHQKSKMSIEIVSLLRLFRRCQVHSRRGSSRRPALQLDPPQVFPLVAGVQLVEVVENSPSDGFLRRTRQFKNMEIQLTKKNVATRKQCM